MAPERQPDQQGDDRMQDRIADRDARTERDIRDAAEEAFVEDQRENPDHPANRRREDTRGIEDPAHSKGSEA